MADNLEKLQMSGKNILVVDQERLGGLIVKMLQKDQVGSELVTDGLKAITKLRSFVPDLIVADVNYPRGWPSSRRAGRHEPPATKCTSDFDVGQSNARHRH